MNVKNILKSSMIAMKKYEERENTGRKAMAELQIMLDERKKMNQELYEKVQQQELSVEDIRQMQDESNTLSDDYNKAESQIQKIKEMQRKFDSTLKALIKETNEKIENFRDSCKNLPVLRQQVSVEFRIDSHNGSQDLIVPSDFFSKIRELAKESLSELDKLSDSTQQEITDLAQKTQDLRLKVQDLQLLVQDRQRELQELQRAGKESPENEAIRIESKTKSLRGLEDSLKEQRNAVNELKNSNRALADQAEMRRREIAKADTEWTALQKSWTDELLEALGYIKLMTARSAESMASIGNFLVQQWEAIEKLEIPRD